MIMTPGWSATRESVGICRIDGLRSQDP